MPLILATWEAEEGEWQSESDLDFKPKEYPHSLNSWPASSCEKFSNIIKENPDNTCWWILRKAGPMFQWSSVGEWAHISTKTTGNINFGLAIKRNIIFPQRVPLFSLVDLYYWKLYSIIMLMSWISIKAWTLSLVTWTPTQYHSCFLSAPQSLKHLLSGHLQEMLADPLLRWA